MSGADSPTATGARSVPGRVARADVLLLVTLGLLWGSAYVAIRQGILAGASPFPFAGARYALVAVLLAAVAVTAHSRFPDRRAVLLSTLVGGTLIIGLYGTLLYWGEQFTSGGYASVLSGTGPILTVVFAYSLLPAERLSRTALVGIAVGFLGILVLVLPSLFGGSGGNWMGPVAITGAFVVFPLGTVLLRRWSRGPEGTWQLSLQFAVGAGVLGLATVASPGPERLPLTFAVWAALAALVVLASLLGYVVYFRLHHRIGPSRANLVAYLLPLVGIGLGSGLFGEAITAGEVVGGILIVVGLSLVFFSRDRESTAVERSDLPPRITTSPPGP